MTPKEDKKIEKIVGLSITLDMDKIDKLPNNKIKKLFQVI